MKSIQEIINLIEYYVPRVWDLDQRCFRQATAELTGLYPEISIAYGCTKGVFMVEDADFVIKVPFTRSGEFYFHNSGSSFREWDYCAREVEVWEAAEAAGVGHLLAKTWEVGEIQGHPIYAQERVENIHKSIWTLEYDLLDPVEDKLYDQAMRLADANTTRRARMDFDMIVVLIAQYGYIATRRFLNLTVREHITGDWHQGNYGTNPANDKVCFCDYTGFFDRAW